MIIWINGAFGSGKTQTAYELHKRMENSYVYDPEKAGYFIRENIPKSILKDDFQDYPMWRTFNYNMIDYIADNYNGAVIVPMTITDKAYYDEIIGALSEKYCVKHFILCAKKETILKRLSFRFEYSNSWAARQIDRCQKAFLEDITECRIETDGLNIYQVVEKIADLAGIHLIEDNRGRLCRLFDRVITQCKHIR